MSRIAKAAGVVLGTSALVFSGAGLAVADAGAEGVAAHSAGVLSGNVLQVPIHIPVNLCGNTIQLGGALNPAFGNTCINKDGDRHGKDHGKGHGKDHGKGHGNGGYGG